MAIPSRPFRPSLRSSTRPGTSLAPEDSPTVDRPSLVSTATRRGKRPHDAFLAHDEQQTQKKQRLNPDAISVSKNAAKPNASKSFSPPFKSSVGVTHPPASVHPSGRITSAAQPLPNGTIFTNGFSQTKDEVPETVITLKHDGNKIKKVHKAVDKRTLRSQDGGSRSKSELSLYFHNYDELISNEPKESEFLTPETIILVVDESPKSSNPTIIASSSTSLIDPAIPISHITLGPAQLQEAPAPRPDSLTEYQNIDFSTITQHNLQYASDPLDDEFYFKAHRRAERQEKQLRNIEKEKAQHEKVQLERLLEGLKGHDWLRVMGISGITDSEKKSFEPKRDHFIREVRCLIDKFKRWKEEEKRRKVEKDLSVRADDEEDEDEDGEEEEGEEDGGTSITSPPDVDTLAALQLHNETVIASKKPKISQAGTSNLQPPPIEKPFTSFYSKSYMREAAIGKHRRGRTRFAFGHPLPDFAERLFKLPTEMLTDDAIRASARSRRRVRRESKDT